MNLCFIVLIKIQIDRCVIQNEIAGIVILYDGRSGNIHTFIAIGRDINAVFAVAGDRAVMNGCVVVIDIYTAAFFTGSIVGDDQVFKFTSFFFNIYTAAVFGAVSIESKITFAVGS